MQASTPSSKMQLRRRYSAEANAHRNMLSRAKDRGVDVHPEFKDFASFLQRVGPMPAKGATLDRIDNADPEYAPGKVRWADRRTQNNNKSDTLIFYCSRTGDTFTASRLAKQQGVGQSTIRKRKERGWTDEEIIAGGRSSLSSTVIASIQSPSLPIKTRFPEGLYTPDQLAMLNGGEGRLSHAGAINFYRNAQYHQRHREEYGEEGFIPTHDELIELLECYITPEQYERKVAKHWPDAKHHVVFSNLPASQRELIARIDPEYVEKQRSKAYEDATKLSDPTDGLIGGQIDLAS